MSRRSKAGKRAQSAGKEWEHQIELANQRYRSQQLADVHRLSEPYTQIGGVGPFGRFTAIRSASSTVDFQGVVRGGRSVILEAKSTALKCTYGMGHVQRHQAEALLRHAEVYGGIAGVAIYWQVHAEAYWIPAVPTGSALLAVPADWCHRAASHRRDHAEALRKRIGRKPTQLELASLAVPPQASVRIDHLRAAGLQVPLVRWCYDWLAVALGA